jgi:hypothetical protein
MADLMMKRRTDALRGLMSAPQRDLLRTKLMLLLIVAGLTVGADRWGAWPMVSWSMYSQTLAPANQEASRWEIQATDRGGVSRVFIAPQLLPIENVKLCDFTISKAAAEKRGDPRRPEPHGRYLINLVRRAWPEAAIVRLEIWQATYSAKPFALPPIDIGRPTRRELVAQLTVDPAVDLTRRGWR